LIFTIKTALDERGFFVLGSFFDSIDFCIKLGHNIYRKLKIRSKKRGGHRMDNIDADDFLIVVDEFFLLHNYRKLFKHFKFLIPNVIAQKIQKNILIDIESVHLIPGKNKDYLKICQSHIVAGTLKDNPDKYEVIGSSETGWVQKIDSFATFFWSQKKFLNFRDQVRIVAALLALQEAWPEKRIIFLSESFLLREFAQKAFEKFKNNHYLKVQGMLPRELMQKA